MRRPVTNRARRTYFNNPLVEETLRHLPAALEHPRSTDFRQYLIEHLHHNSYSTRLKAAEYISSRFAKNGAVNLNLAAALRKFGDSKIGREILYFEYIRAIPVLQDIALRWLAELPDTGTPRAGLLTFVNARLGGRSADKVAGSAVNVFKLLGRISIPKLAHYVPVRSVPPPEAFLYILARMYPEPAMIRVETLTGDNVIRAMLWPSGCVPELLRAAEIAGHVSKISQLDQYHQFTLAGTGQERMRKLLGDLLPAAVSSLREETASYQPTPRPAAPEPPPGSSRRQEPPSVAPKGQDMPGQGKQRAALGTQPANINPPLPAEQGEGRGEGQSQTQPTEPPKPEPTTADQLTLFNGPVKNHPTPKAPARKKRHTP